MIFALTVLAGSITTFIIGVIVIWRKEIWYFLTDRCPCGGKIEFDGYKDRCNKCFKK